MDENGENGGYGQNGANHFGGYDENGQNMLTILGSVVSMIGGACVTT